MDMELEHDTGFLRELIKNSVERSKFFGSFCKINVHWLVFWLLFASV